MECKARFKPWFLVQIRHSSNIAIFLEPRFQLWTMKQPVAFIFVAQDVNHQLSWMGRWLRQVLLSKPHDEVDQVLEWAQIDTFNIDLDRWM